ncbi:MAG: hypothetical protein OEZ06_31810 [Myxococcales bacterium]|nr:hypothetical protein [Myxococcales bacterium]
MLREPADRRRQRILLIASLALGVSACAPCSQRPQPPVEEKTDGGGKAPKIVAAGPSCPVGFGACGEGGACDVDLDRDDAHCGACGQSCGDGQRCLAGSCQSGVVQVAAGGSHSCALTAAGQVSCWGLGSLGQLGPGGRAARLRPSPVEGLADIVQLALGRDVSCARARDGRLWCMGDGGLLGRDEPAPNARPQPVSGLVGAIDVSVSINHACAVVSDGAVYCWGGNVAGQLGDAGVADAGSHKAGGNSSLPMRVRGLGPAWAIATGGAHSCALLRSGQVACWGDNRFGQLGVPGLDADHPHPDPHLLPELEQVEGLAAGRFHSCARRRDGALFCWGRNRAGQLGLGDLEERRKPTQLKLPEGLHVAAVAARERQSCALGRDGQLLCWGDGEGGRLGLGEDERDRPVPTRLPGLSAVAGVGVGESHGCALRRDGAMRCFGLGDGRIGDGSDEARPLPTPVANALAPPAVPPAVPPADAPAVPPAPAEPQPPK